MSTLDELRSRLAALDPLRLDIVDDSARHSGHASASGGGHYRVTIVSAKFSGLGTMARHRIVHDAVGDLMGSKIHALSINARSPDED